MAFAETQQLAVELTLGGNFTSGLAKAEASLKSFGASAVTATSKSLPYLKQAITGTGAALSGMASHFKSVITGPLGLLGLGAGIFSVAGAIKSGIEEAQSFGLEVQKLAGITGQSVEQTSALAAALDHFGISGDAAVKTVGMLAKNLGTIQTSKSGLGGFAKTFGITLTDAKGQLVGFNEEVLRTADYFNNKSIPYQTKALALQKLYGRSWQSLVPFLQAGRKGITEAEQAAKDLGLTLNAQNLGDLKTYRESFLTLGDAMKGLELQVGLVLMPVLSDLAKNVTNFLKNGGREKIVAFFKEGAQWARQFGDVLANQIIPTIKGLGSAALGAWNSIPAPLRDLLFKGIVADRTIKFLFGVSPIHLATDLLGDIAGPIIKTLLGNRLVPQPVIIVGGGTPGLPSGAGDLLPAAGGAGALVIGTTLIASVAASTWAFLQTYHGPKASAPGSFTPTLNSAFDNRPIRPSDFKGIDWAQIASNLTGVKGTQGDVESNRGNIGGALSMAENIKRLPGSIKALERAEVGAHGATRRAIVAEIKVEKAVLHHDLGLLKTARAAVVKKANTILDTGAAHDKETSAAITQLAHRPFVLKDTLNLHLPAARPPSVSTTVNVSVTAGGIHRTVVTHSRYGPSVGSRYSGSSSGGDKWANQ